MNIPFSQAKSIGYALTGRSGGISPVIVQSSPANSSSVDISSYTGSEGSAYFEVTDSSMITGNDSVIFNVHAGSGNRIFVQKRTSSGGRFRVLTQSGGGTNEIYDGFLSSFANGTQRFLVTWDSTTFRLWVNGMPICQQAGNFTGVTFTDIEIGDLNSGGFTYNGTVNEFRYYDGVVGSLQAAQLTGAVQIRSGITLDTTKDSFVIAGQSNSVGQASGSPSYTNTGDMFLLTNAMNIESYSDPYEDPTGALITALSDTAGNYDVGWAGYFADDLAGLTSRDIMVCPAGLSGTSFFGATPTWNIDAATYRTSGTKITGMVATSTAFINQLQLIKQVTPIKSVLWGQGEGDVVNGTSEANYETQLTELINIARNALNQNIPWFNCGFPDNTGDWAGGQSNWDAIDDAQVDVANAVGNCYMVEGTDIAGASGDRVHYDLSGYESVGGTIATRVDSVLYS